jgi:hypothetical protein
MSLFYKPLHEISIDDINSLIDNQVHETRNLEYKSKLPGTTNKEKKDFLAEVTAMANSGGGDIIFGIEEKEDSIGDKKYALRGISRINEDTEKNRLDCLLRDGIQPRIIYYHFVSIPIDETKQIYLLRIPRSLNTPHMVTLGGSQKFYARNSSGKYPMEINEIRTSFLSGSTYLEIAKNWRLERIALIKNNETFIRLNDEAKLVLHVIPLNYDHMDDNINLKQMHKTISNNYGEDLHYNFDGIFSKNCYNHSYQYKHNFSINNITYFQFFRNGQIESVDDKILNSKEKNLTTQTYEKEIIWIIELHLKYYKQINVTPPFVIGITLLGIKDYTIKDDTNWRMRIMPDIFIKDDDIILPNLIIQDFNDDIPKALKPAYDMVWNACGYAGSFNYDENGNWKYSNNS